MKTIFTLSFALLCSGINAAELRLVSSRVDGSCQTLTEKLEKQARKEVTHKAGNRFKSVGRWNERSFTRGLPYAPDICSIKGVWSEALFLHENEINTEYFITFEQGVSNPRVDWNIPGDDELSDEEAWERAIEESKKRALIFCRDAKVVNVISKSKKIFTGRT